jgi:hypothetical protein
VSDAEREIFAEGSNKNDNDDGLGSANLLHKIGPCLFGDLVC